MRVLLVDDDPDQLELRQMVLARHGFESESATGTHLAVEVARRHAPDIAIVDLRLPREADGLALISQLKHELPDVCIVVLTGSDPERLRHLPQMDCVARLIQKGTGSANLITALNELAEQVAR